MGLLTNRQDAPSPGDEPAFPSARRLLGVWLWRCASLALLLLWAVFIFRLSSLSPEELPDEVDLFSWLGKLRDVLFHFVLYGVLGALLTSLAWSWKGRAALGWPWLLLGTALGLAYGVSDEVHQSLTPGRSATLLDVVVDGAGVATAIAFWSAVAAWSLPRLAGRWLFLSLLASLVFAALAPAMASAQEPVQPQVLSLTLGALAASPGEPVRVEARVRNPSNKGEEFTLLLFVDDAPQESRVVRLPPGAIRTVRFTVVRAQPGTHVVRLGPQAASFQVLSLSFLLRELVVSPLVVGPGDLVTVRATVENTGPAPVVYQAPLFINNVLVDVRTDLLPLGSKAVVTFQVAKPEPGVYSVLLGNLTGLLIVAARDLDVVIPSSLGINPSIATAHALGGRALEITGNTVALVSAPSTLVATLPVRLEPGQSLGSFQDLAAGIVYEASRLTIPLKDDLNRVAARMVLTPSTLTGEAAQARLTGALSLEIPDTLLHLPASVTPAAPISFSMSTPLSSLTLGTPLRLTPGLEPRAALLAPLEEAAQKSGKTLESVVASVTPDIPGALTSEAPSAVQVSFTVPQTWLTSLPQGVLRIARVSPEGLVELQPPVPSPPQFGRVDLKSAFPSPHGAFLLVTLRDAAPAQVTGLLLSAPFASVGSAVEARAVVRNALGQSVGLANLTLKVNGQPFALAPVVTQPDGSMAALFHLSPSETGVYALTVGGAQAKLEVGLRDVLGHIQVTEVNVTPKTMVPGQPVEVAASLVNVGDKTLVGEVYLDINGAPVEKRVVLLGPGATSEALFVVSRFREGEYEVSFLSRRASFTVAAAPKPPNLHASALALENTSLNPGDAIQATFLVSNTGDLPGVYTARVFVGAKEMERQEIPLDGLTEMPVTVRFPPPGEGIFTLEVEGMRREFVVVSPLQRADLVVVTLEMEPATVSGGEPVIANVVIRNREARVITSTLYVLVNAKAETQSDLTAPPQQTVQRIFTIIKQIPGYYEVEMRLGRDPKSIISIYRGRFLVTRPQSLPSWEIALLEVLPQPAVPYEPVQVSFLLSNLGQLAGELEVIAAVDDRVEWREVIGLGPQSTRPVSLTLPGRAPGTYTLDVNDIRVRFVVGSSLTPAPSSQPSPAPRGGAPFGGGVATLAALALVALAAAGIGLYLLRRRR